MGIAPPPPTGRQHEIRRGDQVVHAVEVGGGLRAYQVARRPVLDGYAAHEPVTGARGQQLTPWPNRLEDGAFDWDGEHLQVALSEPENHNAIHGLARWASWQSLHHGGESVTLGHRIHPQPGWPWLLEIEVTYALTGEGLLVRTTTRNLSNRPAPFGHGAHPYLTVGTATIDEAEVQIPADAYLPTNGRGLPTGEVAVEGDATHEEKDFRRSRSLRGVHLDTSFSRLRRDGDGRVRVRLSHRDRSVTLWADQTYPWIEVFTGDTLPPDKRRTGLGVEPMSMPPNGLRSGEGVLRLEPGAEHVGEWGITPG